jgi:hypothetical protein
MNLGTVGVSECITRSDAINTGSLLRQVICISSHVMWTGDSAEGMWKEEVAGQMAVDGSVSILSLTRL